MSGGASLLIAGALCALNEASALELDDRFLRIGDVASLACVVPERRAAIGELPIASLDRTRSLTREAMAALVRRRVPALAALELSGPPQAPVHIARRPTIAAPAAAQCYVAATDLDAGAPLAAHTVAPSACDGGFAGAPVRYDRRRGLMRAHQAIAAGEQLGRLAPAPASSAGAGQEMTLLVTLGPVVIERHVETVQPSAGGAVFVRDADGAVFAAPLPAEAPS